MLSVYQMKAGCFIRKDMLRLFTNKYLPTELYTAYILTVALALKNVHRVSRAKAGRNPFTKICHTSWQSKCT